MTDQRKDEMPDEIYVGRTPDGTAIWTGSKDVGRLIDSVKYIRADLSSPVPDDVASALNFITDELVAFIKECDVEDGYIDRVERSFKIIRAASTPSAEVRSLVAALTKIQTISAHMESKRSGELNKIASQSLAPYQKDFL